LPGYTFYDIDTIRKHNIDIVKIIL